LKATKLFIICFAFQENTDFLTIKVWSKFGEGSRYLRIPVVSFDLNLAYLPVVLGEGETNY